MKKIVLFICALISIYSCNTQKKESDLDKAGLKGDVVLISETYQYDKNDPILYISQYENGFLIREYGKLGNLDEYQKIYHYKNDYLERIYTDKFEEGKIRQDVEVFNYDSNMNLIKKTSVINGKSWNYEYYFSNNKLQKESVSSGNVKSITNYYYSEFLDSTYTESENLLQDFNKTYYNSLGQSIKSIITYGDLEVTIINEYNEKGDIIKLISSKNTRGSDKEIDEIDYVYDVNGNWTSKISKYHDGSVSKSTREIFYTGDDFNKVSKILDEASSRILAGDSHAQPDEYIGSNKVPSPENDSKSEGSIAQENSQTERQKQWVNCNKCKGTGKIVCDKCNGTTLMFCGTCDGRGTFNSGNGSTTCYYCKGALKVKCDSCYGKGIKGNCGQCGGRGQVQQ
jgi:hypothetical protein